MLRGSLLVCALVGWGCGDEEEPPFDPVGVYVGAVSRTGHAGRMNEDIDENGIGDARWSQFDVDEDNTRVTVSGIDARHVLIELWDGCRLRVLGSESDQRWSGTPEAEQRCRIADGGFDADARLFGNVSFQDADATSAVISLTADEQRGATGRAGTTFLDWRYHFEGRRIREPATR